MRRSCVNLQGRNGRHCRLERLIGRAVPVLASLCTGLRPSTITVSISGSVMTCRRRMAESCRSVARVRSAAWCHRNQDRLAKSAAVSGRSPWVGLWAGSWTALVAGASSTAGAIGEETVVADAMEALRQSMQQKAADELVGIECHHFGLAVRSIVFPGKANLPVGEREQPAVGDGDAMGIAAEIGQHLFGASERWFGVDHPVEAAEFAQATRESLRFG